MNRRTNLLFVALLLCHLAFGQVQIRGVVTDQHQQPIPGANVYLDGTYDGTSSNPDGTFSFLSEQTGRQLLVVSFIGYKTYSDSIEMTTGTTYDITMQEEASQMAGVVISAGTFEASDEVKGQVLKPVDIVTTAGATADIAGALNALPGTQTVGEQGRLFVRGGDSYETTTFIDGVLVVDSYDRSAPNVPTRNRFSPMMFKGTSFSTGGYSAEHGQGLSSALILKTKDVATQNRSDISLMSVGVEGAHTQVFDGSSLSAKVGYINLAPYFKVVPQETEYTTAPTAFDGNISYRKELAKGGYFKVYSKFNQSDMGLNYLPVDSMETFQYDIRNNFGYIGASYNQILSDKWILDAGVGFTSSKDIMTHSGSDIDELSQALHAKVGAGVDLSHSLFVKFGTELFYFNHYQDYRGSEGFDNLFSVDPYISASYLEAELYLTRNFLIRAGGRLEYYSLAGPSVDPRISAAYKTGEFSQVSMAYGIFRQAPPSSFSRVASELLQEKATHYIASYQWTRESRVFRVEGYWKDYNDLVKFDPSEPYNPLLMSNNGYGYAKGLDLFWRDGDNIPNSDYWVSYSFLDTERDYKEFPYSAAPSFSSKHNFSFVYKYFISAWRTQVGTTYSFATGRPYTDPNSNRFLSERTPNYSDLSMNISYLIRSNMILYLSATNLLGRENIFGYEYGLSDASGEYPGRPVTLPAKRFLFVGFFLTLSKENTLNQLPNL